MKHFLLIYDRSAGALVREVETFGTSVEAMRGRFAAEIEFEARPEVEVVAIDAATESDLHRTHGRYFYSPPLQAVREAGRRRA